jgi:hypothetical protein
MDTRLAATVPFMTFVLPMAAVTFGTCRLPGLSHSSLPKRPSASGEESFKPLDKTYDLVFLRFQPAGCWFF